MNAEKAKISECEVLRNKLAGLREAATAVIEDFDQTGCSDGLGTVQGSIVGRLSSHLNGGAILPDLVSARRDLQSILDHPEWSLGRVRSEIMAILEERL